MNNGNNKFQNKNPGFEAIARESFRWLEDHGYCVTGASSTIVRYEGQLGFVNVYHGRSSSEVGVEVGAPGDEQIASYSMSELIRLKDDDEAKKYRNPVATSPQTMKGFLEIQAQRLKVYGQRIFSGNTMIWNDLEQQRQRWSKEYAMDVLVSQVRSEAQRSFRDHNFNRVVELLSSIERRLTPAEYKKLEYSRRKLRSSTHG
jgi:hypothetical protein